MQIKIIHRPNAQYTRSRKSGPDTIHEGTARGAKVIRHIAARSDGLRLAPGFEVVAAAEVFEVGVGDDEVGGEHGGGDFAAVGAVADEGVY